MVGEPPRAIMHRCVVVAVGERNSAWRACWCLGSFQGVDQGTMHLMVGSSTGVEMFVGKVHQKNFPATIRCSDGVGRLRSFL